MHGDLGNSFWYRTPVTSEIFMALPVTFELGLLAFITAMIIGIPIGMYSAIRQDTIGDYIGRSFAILCIALPGFWLGTLIMVFPSIWWDWSPSIFLIHFADDPLGNLQMFIIPAVIMWCELSPIARSKG